MYSRQMRKIYKQVKQKKKPLLLVGKTKSRGSKRPVSVEFTTFLIVLPRLSNLQCSAPAQPANDTCTNAA
jgi:hypothetical protein